MRPAASIHCNGYPIFDAAQRHNSRALLNLDSRMSSEMVIPPNRLEQRLGCCHVQADRSCTYLESLDAGLPILGCSNRMWRGLAKASVAGCSAPIGRPEKLADAVASLTSNLSSLTELS
jgi:hypothetical protein